MIIPKFHPVPTRQEGTLWYGMPNAAGRAQRLDIAKAALTGLLAAGGDHTNPDIPAARAVRYADALLAALNRTHEEARHAAGNR